MTGSGVSGGRRSAPDGVQLAGGAHEQVAGGRPDLLHQLGGSVRRDRRSDKPRTPVLAVERSEFRGALRLALRGERPLLGHQAALELTGRVERAELGEGQGRIEVPQRQCVVGTAQGRDDGADLGGCYVQRAAGHIRLEAAKQLTRTFDEIQIAPQRVTAAA